ncbi:MAG: FAD-dependent oxidoreductase [Dehalococcoidales bacterium]|jgi:NADPH-dependent 2,4-dienoyl-CoA reductase/sulfur reductase-like enzyme/rhodanese-related sulfurtransferase
MANPNNIAIIGGTACGPKAAARARRRDQAARITIIEQRDNLSTATCGLPYFISGVVKEGDLISRQTDYFRNVFDMNVLTNTKALSINRQAHTVEINDLKTDKYSSLLYDKLVIATGATPTVPNWEGKDLKGIFTLNNIPDAADIRDYVEGLKSKQVVIVGAGLIGLEAAENFISAGLKVTILEALGWPLPALLDAEIGFHVEKQLKDKGVKVNFGQSVSGFRGDSTGQVRQVMVGDKAIDAGMVLLALGVRPNVTLAKEAGLTIGATGGLAVNEHLRTSDPDIYAGGDCVEVTNLITQKKALVPMGSTANKHGRVIGTNVTGGSETFPGVVGTAVVKVFDLNVGRTGLSEAQARVAGYDVVTALVPGVDHANYYPGSRDVFLKMVSEKSSGKLLGGQAVGTGDTSKRIDVLATALTFGARADDMANIDLSYAPPYNSAMDPLHNAANVIRNKQTGQARALAAQEVKSKIDKGDKFVLLDVRSPQEWRALHIAAPQVKLLPLPELRQRLGELAKDEEIVILCRTSVRAYQAQRILDGAGFKDVKFMDGSISSWPYETASSPPEK